MAERSRTYREIYTFINDYTKDFTVESGGLPFNTKSEIKDAEKILSKYYNNVERTGLDYNRAEIDGTDYVIEFSEPKDIDEEWDDDGLNYMPNKAPTAGPIAGGVSGGMGESMEDLDEDIINERKYIDKRRKALANAGFNVDGMCEEEILNLYQDVCGIEPYDKEKIIKKYDLHEAINQLKHLDEELNRDSMDIYEADELIDYCESILSGYNYIDIDKHDNVIDINYNEEKIREVIEHDLQRNLSDDELDPWISVNMKIDADPNFDVEHYNNEDVNIVKVSLTCDDFGFDGFDNYFNSEEWDNQEELERLKRNLENYYDDDIVYTIRDNIVEMSESLNEDKHEELNPDIWDDNKELKPEVKDKIKEIVNRFDDNLKQDGVELDIKDIVIVGSNASFNYTKNSDIDIHIVADTSVYEDQKELAVKLYNAYKILFNNKYDPKIYGHECEVYVEPDSVHANSNGIYSLNNGWVKEPVKGDIPDVDRDELNKQLQPFIEEANKAETIEDVDKVIDKLYILRQESILKDGEYGMGNLVFKEFRNNDYMKDLKDKKVELENKQMSLENLQEERYDIYSAIRELNEDVDDLYEISATDVYGDTGWKKNIPESELFKEYDESTRYNPVVSVYKHYPDGMKEVYILDDRIYDNWEREEFLRDLKRDLDEFRRKNNNNESIDEAKFLGSTDNKEQKDKYNREIEKEAQKEKDAKSHSEYKKHPSKYDIKADEDLNESDFDPFKLQLPLDFGDYLRLAYQIGSDNLTDTDYEGLYSEWEDLKPYWAPNKEWIKQFKETGKDPFIKNESCNLKEWEDNGYKQHVWIIIDEDAPEEAYDEVIAACGEPDGEGDWDEGGTVLDYYFDDLDSAREFADNIPSIKGVEWDEEEMDESLNESDEEGNQITLEEVHAIIEDFLNGCHLIDWDSTDDNFDIQLNDEAIDLCANEEVEEFVNEGITIELSEYDDDPLEHCISVDISYPGDTLSTYFNYDDHTNKEAKEELLDQLNNVVSDEAIKYNIEEENKIYDNRIEYTKPEVLN